MVRLRRRRENGEAKGGLESRYQYAFGLAPDLITESRVRLNLDSYERRLREMREAWKAYYGGDSYGQSKWGLPVEKQLKVKDGEDDPNLELNFARLIVNKSATFLFGQDIVFDIDDTRASAAAGERYLEGFWKQNKKMSLLQKLAINGGVAGHGAVKINPVGEDGRAYPSLRVINPSMLIVFFDPDDIDEVEEYRIEWNYTDVVQGQLVPVFRRQRHLNEGSYWQIIDEEGTSGLGPWTAISDVKWPFPFSAVVECQNLPNPNEYYGSPDLEPDILRVINRLNFIVSDWNKALRLHASPREYGTGFDANQIKSGGDEMLVIPNENAKLGLLEMASDMTSTSMLYEKVKQALHEIARIPEVSVGKTENIGVLSGVALEILYQPLLELTYVKRMTYGPVLEEINRRVLWISGKGRNVEVKNQWPPLLPTDPVEQRAVADKDLNVLKIASRETIAGDLGRDWDQEKGRIAEDQVADLAQADKEAQVNGTGKYAPARAAGGGSSSGGGGAGSKPKP